jgi:hypothetical protein
MIIEQWSPTPLGGCDNQPYHYRYALEDGTVIDVPDGAFHFFVFDGKDLYLRIIDEDGMTDYPMDSASGAITDCRTRSISHNANV